jgi:hypothetical protein
MRNSIPVTALVILSAVLASFLVGWPSKSSGARFCEDRKIGKAGPAGGLSDLIEGDRRQLEQVLASLSGKPTETRGVCR